MVIRVSVWMRQSEHVASGLASCSCWRRIYSSFSEVSLSTVGVCPPPLACPRHLGRRERVVTHLPWLHRLYVFSHLPSFSALSFCHLMGYHCWTSVASCSKSWKMWCWQHCCCNLHSAQILALWPWTKHHLPGIQKTLAMTPGCIDLSFFVLQKCFLLVYLNLGGLISSLEYQ